VISLSQLHANRKSESSLFMRSSYGPTPSSVSLGVTDAASLTTRAASPSAVTVVPVMVMVGAVPAVAGAVICRAPCRERHMIRAGGGVRSEADVDHGRSGVLDSARLPAGVRRECLTCRDAHGFLRWAVRCARRRRTEREGPGYRNGFRCLNVDVEISIIVTCEYQQLAAVCGHRRRASADPRAEGGFVYRRRAARSRAGYRYFEIAARVQRQGKQ
jgi:hypothetical protein